MKQLKQIRRQLARLRRRRQRFRWLTAWSAVAIAALSALAAVFLLDWLFQRSDDVWQRVCLIALGAAGVVWAVRRFALPWWGKHEDDMEMALLVQRQSGVDTDLVAALQFESSDAAQWGSTQLETAVVQSVAKRQRQFDVMASLPREPLLRRMKVLAVAVIAAAIVCLLVPQHVRIFFERMMLGSQRYPSQTRIVSLTVNGKSVDRTAPDKGRVHVAYGRPVQFEVQAAGVRPAAGRVELSLDGRGKPAIVPLEDKSGTDADGDRLVFKGQYDRLLQTMRYQVYLGDTWSDPLVLDVTPLPVVDVEPEVVPPIYARRTPEEVVHIAKGMRQFSVLEGSEVRMKIRSSRPLKAARLTLGEATLPMTRVENEIPHESGGDEVWAAPSSGTPLAAMAADTRYSIQATDPDDQPLEHPIDGFIRIEPDAPPRVAAATKTPFVLPNAAPTIYYGATDDHALNSVWLTWEATRADAAKPSDNPEESKTTGRIELCRFPPEKSQRSREAQFPFDLRSLHLHPGDTLRVTLHASDYRGVAEGATTDLETPLAFQVTDIHGIEASMLEHDEKSAGTLETMRRNLTGLGESP